MSPALCYRQPGMLLDIRFGVRHLLSHKATSLSLILVLGVGIGANTAMFSGFEAWVLRPLDFPEPERLVMLQEAQPKQGRYRLSVSPRNYADWVDQQRSFEAAGAFHRHRYNLADVGEPVRLDGTRVSATLFPLLGKSPILGRSFEDEDDRPGQPADVALISERLWRERFESDPDVVGRTLRLDGRVHTIVGVMEAGFRFPEWAEIWTPLGLDVDASDRSDRWLSIVARLSTNATIASAQADLDAIAERLEREFPRANRDYTVRVMPLREGFVPPVIEVALTASLASGIFVLLVICANVASLLLAQASARMRETAMRSALGASRMRLVRQNLVEGSLLALPAGILGAFLGLWGVRSMLAYIPVEPPYLFQMGFSLEAGVYTLLASIVAGLGCALAPVVRSSGARIFEALKSGGRQSGGVSSHRVRSSLIVAEIALSTALVAVAFLMVRSFLALQATEPGFEPEGILTAELALENEELASPEARVALAERLVSGLAELSSTDSAAAVSRLPATQSNEIWEIRAEGGDSETSDPLAVTVHSVVGNYFETLGIRLIEGRPFTDAEVRDGDDVVVVSDGLARHLWGGTNVVGRRLGIARMDSPRWYRVVGIVGDVDIGRDMVNADLPTIQLYQPFASNPTSTLALVVRTRGGLRAATAALRKTVHGLAPGIPVSEVLTMNDAIFRVRWVSRFFSRQLVIYALLAILIASVGLYGLTLDAVTNRTKELAIRLALGAHQSQLVLLVLQEALYLGATGIVAGLVLTFAFVQTASSMLVSVSTRDPLPLVIVGGVLFLVLLLAAFHPARRASLLDPITALRTE